MIEIKDIKDIDYQVLLLDPEGNAIGEVKTYMQYLDICVQIKEKHLKGYAFKCHNNVIRIDCNGNLEYYPDGFFDKPIHYLCKLI